MGGDLIPSGERTMLAQTSKVTSAPIVEKVESKTSIHPFSAGGGHEGAVCKFTHSPRRLAPRLARNPSVSNSLLLWPAVCSLLLIAFTSSLTLAQLNSHKPNSAVLGNMLHRTETSTATDSAFGVLGRWAWGPCRAVEVCSHYALIGQGSMYQVYDISIPSAPRPLYDTTLDDWVTDIKVRDSLLFILFNRSLMVCRARPIFPLVELGRVWPGAGLFADMAISDSLVYVLADLAGVLAINVSDPTHPYYRYQYGVVGDFGPSAIAAKGNYVYYGALGPGFPLIILESVPDSGFRVNGLNVGGNVLSAYVSDTLLFVGESYGSFQIYSIVDPWNPRLVDSVRLGSSVLRSIRRAENLYCSTVDSGFMVLNISDLLHPAVIGRTHARGGDKLARSDSALVAATYDGVDFFSIAEQDPIEEVLFSPTGGEPSDIAFKGRIGVVACGSAGLWTVDFSDSKHPASIANLQGRDYFHVTLNHDLACCITIRNVNGVSDSLVVCRLNNAGTLSRLAAVELGGEARSIVSRDSLVFVGTHGSIKIYDIADPIHPSLLSSWSSSGDHRLSLEGNVLYAASGVGEGLSILDVSDVLLPRQIAHLSMDAVGVLVSDTLAYIGTQGLAIADVADPAAPVVISNLTTPGTGDQAHLAKDQHFIYKTGVSLDAVDVSDPRNPLEVTTLFPDSGPEAVAAGSDTLYVVDPNQGVWIVRNNFLSSVPKDQQGKPSDFKLLQNYPNPFNPSTVIRFALPTPSVTSLKVYDLLGRHVATVVNQPMDAGEHTVEWNAEGFASGVYFYRLRTDKFNSVRKMTLIR